MKYITTKKELQESNIAFIRKNITKTTWKVLNPNTQLEVCTHILKDWDCGCSFGCDCCSYSYECVDCKSKLTYHQRNLASIHLVK